MRIACCQMDVELGNWEKNFLRIAQKVRELADQKADLALFPEAALTGYCVATPQEAAAIALPSDSIYFDRLADLSRETGVAIVVGYAAVEAGVVTNRATFFDGGQRVTYQKTHLPILGLDRFVEPGDELFTFETRFGRLGMLICYDLRLPEPARALALMGAELILMPTNWPLGAEVSADVIAPVRALENRVFLATCNRIGHEAGFEFFGHSRVFGPSGVVLAEAASDEGVVWAEIDLAEAREKRVVTRPGQHEVELFGSRRPDLYGSIASSNVGLWRTATDQRDV